MEKVNLNIKTTIVAGAGKYPWNNVLYTAMIGQSINSVLSLINQIVYYNNPNPYYKQSSVYNDSASRLYLRAQSSALKSNISIGSPYL